MYITESGVNDLALVRVTNPHLQTYCIVWDCREVVEEDGTTYTYKCEEFDHKPTIEEVQAAVMADHDHEEYDWNEYAKYLNNED